MRHKQIISLIVSMLLAFSISDLSAQKRSHAHHAHGFRTKNAKIIINKPGRYASLPRWGARVRSIDIRSNFIVHKNRKYYCHSGVFYRKGLMRYRVVKATIGIKVNVIPKETVCVNVNSQPYYYYFGTFYKKINDQSFETVNPPQGAFVDDLPNGIREFELDGETFYKLDDVFYKPIENTNGNLVYMVMGTR